MSGRLASGDAGEQYRQSSNFVRTGHLYADRVSSHLWLPGQDGHLYEVHDPGNPLLMLPAAALDTARDPAGSAEPPDHLSAFLVSLTYAAFASAALFALLYALGDQLRDPRRAGIALLIFVFATTYAAYQKTAWDVLGACLATCFALAAAVLVRRRAEAAQSVAGTAVALGASIALAAAFRFTWAPFLALGLLGAMAAVRMPRLGQVAIWTGATALLLCLPQFAYNALRSGSPLRPHTASYSADPFSGQIADGFLQYLVAPEFGLLVYCPLFLLFLIPAVHRRVRWPPWPVLVAVLLYALLLAATRLRTGPTWGPRYFVPAIPLLFFVLTAGVERLLEKPHWRRLAVAATAASLVVGVAALLFPWQDDLHSWHGGHAVLSASPWSLDRAELVADALIGGVTGSKEEHGFVLQGGRDITENQGFPDFWWVSAIENGGVTSVVGVISGLLLIVAFAASSRALWRMHTPRLGDGAQPAASVAVNVDS